MRVRALLWLTAIVSSILGAVVVYLVLTVPNDLRADALMKQARADLKAGKMEKARTSLGRIIQQYPRTDAAAAATIALSDIDAQEREKLAAAIALLQKQQQQQNASLQNVQKTVTDIKATPPPAPVIVQAPAKPPVKKKAPPKRRTTRRRRR